MTSFSYVQTDHPHLAKETIINMDPNKSTAITSGIISRQATMNIGLIGHVAHGKSTVVRSLSGISTGQFQDEKKLNRTIKLGYGNAKIYECDNENCPRPERFRSDGSNKADVFACDRPGCGGQFRLIRHVSFVDCPGHDTLMTTMLNGAAIMDAALLLIAANEPFPQPQTCEHLAAISFMNLKSILILQNKVDLVTEAQAKAQYREIVNFVKGTNAEGAPIIPISAQCNYNIDVIAWYIAQKISVPVRDLTSKPRLIVVRSFDVNKPGAEIDDLKGGVLGGSILQGVLKVGQDIEVRPGIVSKDREGRLQCRPLISKIVSLYTEKNDLSIAVPGGLIGVGTRIDPCLCRADRLVGHVLGEVGTLPDIYIQIQIKYFLPCLFSVIDNRSVKAARLKVQEFLMINIGSLTTGGQVLAANGDLATIQLANPVCTEVAEKITISRRVGNKNFRLIGWGKIERGAVIQPSLST